MRKYFDLLAIIPCCLLPVVVVCGVCFAFSSTTLTIICLVWLLSCLLPFLFIK